MTFIEKVKESVELTTGCRFFYHAAGELNEVLAGVEIGDDPIAFAYLLKGGEVAVGKNCREGVNLAVFFCKKTEFDFNSYENEQLIDECKQLAFGWVSWFSKSNTLEIVGNVTTERVYDTTTDILTGIAVNITLRELVGYGMCDIKKPVLIIEKNGVYTFGAYDLKVEVLPKNVDLSVKENGTYLPSEYGVDAFKKVDVDVPQRGWKMVFTDGTEGRLNVKELWSGFTFQNNSSLVELDTSTYKIDTSKVNSLRSFFLDCHSLKSIDLRGFDTSNVTTMLYVFLRCNSLKSIDLGGIDTSNVTSMGYFLSGCRSLESIDLRALNTSNVVVMYTFIEYCTSLKSADLTSFDTSKVTDITAFFRECYSLKTIIGSHTLEDIENGLRTFFGLKISISASDSPLLRYSSMISMLNGFADMTGGNAQTVTFNSTAWNEMKNDDDTIPTSDVISERQARLSAIAAQKNWNIAH